MSSKTYLTLPVAPNEYDSVQESTFRKTVQDNLQDIANEFLDSGNHSRKDASLSLRRFQFVPTATQKPSVGEFFNLNVGGSVVVSSILDEDNMASDSDTALATQQSIKAYIDSSPGGPTSLNGLTDVTITTPSADQVLKYNGSLWVNSAVPSVSLSSLSDVTITSVATNDYLRWSGSAWVNDASSPSGVTQISSGAGISLSPSTITSTGTVSMDLLGLELLTNPGANKVPFYRNAGSTFDWLLFDSNDFQYSTSTTLSLASGAVGFTDAGTGLVASGAANDTVSVKYSSGSNLIDGAASGTIAGADDILFWDNDDSTVKKDSVNSLLTNVAMLDENEVVAGLWSFSQDIRVNAGVALQNEGSDLAGTAGYQTLYSYNNGGSFELRLRDGTGTIKNIPLSVGSSANDALPVYTGTDHELEPDTNLTFSGGGTGTLTAPFFSGNGSNLTNINADTYDVTNLTTEAATYYPMMVDGVGGGVSGFVNSTDLRWKNTATANQLLLADGVAADPIIGFISDEDTGMYLSSTGQLAFAIGGEQKAYFRAHGLALTNTSTGDRIFDWDGSGDSRITMITNQGGISIGADSSIVILAGDNDDQYVSGRGIVAGTTAENLHLAADSNVYIAPNQQSGYTTARQWVFSTTGSVRPYYDGAVATPTYSFGNDQDTGMWLNGTGVLAFSVRGVNRFQIDESGTTTARTQFDATQVYNTEGDRITTSGNVTLNWDTYNQVDITNDGTARIVTIDDNSMQDGGHYVLVINYTSGVINSWTWSATGILQWQGGSAPTLPTATVGDRTVITFVKTGGITLGFYADAPA